MEDNADDMGKEDRSEKILEYLSENQVALAPADLHHQLVLFKGATFSTQTTRRRLQEFLDSGYVEKIDRGKGLYRITGAGRERLTELQNSN